MKNYAKHLLFFAAAIMIATASMAQVKLKKASAAKKQQPAKQEAAPININMGTTGQKGDKTLYADEWTVPASTLKFMQLPYAYDALEPVIDKLTVEIHYSRHHRAYYDNFLKAIAGTDMEKMNIYDIFFKISDLPAAVRNNAGGYFNHALYWHNMSQKGGGNPSGELARAIDRTFGSFDEFKKRFDDAAKTRFGSGWAWLAVDLKSGELFVSSTANQDNPLMNTESNRGFPILGIDVWEHAYYLKYQNKRADYVESFWKIINWNDVEARYTHFLQTREKFLR